MIHFARAEEFVIAEHARVVFTVDVPEQHIAAGDVGTIVHIYADSAAYEVEVFTLNGRTLDVVAVEAGQVRPVTNRDVLRARVLSA